MMTKELHTLEHLNRLGLLYCALCPHQDVIEPCTKCCEFNKEYNKVKDYVSANLKKAKKTLVWENLQFKKDPQGKVVLLNGMRYKLTYSIGIWDVNLIDIDAEDGENILCLNVSDPKDGEFFNNLQLVEVKDE